MIMKKNDTILVSIIIPVYNEEKNINDCLTSLSKQNFHKHLYEIICVDDGSVDNSLNIIKSFKADIPIQIISQKNEGPAKARNIGANNANGDIIIFTDADCELHPNWLFEMLRPFDDTRIDGVQGRYKTKQTESISLFDQLDIERRYIKMEGQPFIDSIGTYSAAYRKKLFHKYGGFNTKYKTACGEDFEFSFLMASNGHKMVFAEKAICYHKHPNTLLSYLKVKFKRGYWRTLLYKNNKKKVIKDSYTSLALRIQFLLVLLTLISIPINIFYLELVIFPIIFLSFFIILCIPFIKYAFDKHRFVAIVSPFIFLSRSIFFIAGMCKGTFHLIKGKLN